MVELSEKEVSLIVAESNEQRQKFGTAWYVSFKRNLKTVMSTVAAEDIKKLYLTVYDELASAEEAQAGSAIKGKDPLSLKNLRGIFEAQLQQELSAIKVSNGQIELNIMNKEKLGYGSSDPSGAPTTVDVLRFYLEGIPDEHAYVTVEQYKVGRKGSTRGKNTGRVGGGFLMSRKDYEREGWEKITGVPFADVRHPISGQKGFSGFDEVPAKIDMEKYLNLALLQTNKDFKS